MAGGVDARKEQRGDLREHLGIGEGLARLGVLGLQQQLRKAASLQLRPLDVCQQAAHYVLQSQNPPVSRRTWCSDTCAVTAERQACLTALGSL